MSSADKHVAFSVSAGCFFYQMGIAYFIQKHFDISEVKFSGASGGSWPAVLLAAEIDVKEALEVILKHSPNCVEERSWKIFGAYGVYDKGVALAFEILCGDLKPSLPERVNGRLGISVTRLAWEKVNVFGVSRPYFKDEVVSQFYSSDDILQCIIASALIPFALNGRPFVKYRDWICADGGITNVSGVRRFASELAHDIGRMEEMLEEGLEQAQRLSKSYASAINELNIDRNTTLHHALHDSAPESSGPYGVVYIPLDVTRKITSGLSYLCSNLVSTGLKSVSDKVDSVCHKSAKLLASYGMDLGKLHRLTTTAETGVKPAQTCDASSRDDGDDDASVESDIEDIAIYEYPSWPVPGLIFCDKNSQNSSTAGTVISEDDECLHKSDIESGADSNVQTRESPPDPKPEDGIVSGESTYWKVKTPVVSRIPNGRGLQLEISPWMWRHQPVLNYHLSSDPEACRRLFEMGMVDAAEHYFDLMKFFSPNEYLLLMK